MRIYLYLIAGITSALIGWNIGQFFLTDLGLFSSFPELILYPCIAISLAIGMVLNEIFISSPTRPKLCLKKAKFPVLIALGLGLIIGLFSGAIAQILFLPFFGIPAVIVRIVGWLLIGVAVGLAEGLTWRWETVEAGDKKRFLHRLIASIGGAMGASFLAAILFEVVRVFLQEMPKNLRLAEDPIGFSVLGLFLGLTFSLTSSPSYLVALRAGSGFEYVSQIFAQISPESINLSKDYPRIDQSVLTFVSDSSLDRIEEGLSIKLPSKGSFKIGSNNDCHIYIPSLPDHVATIEIKSREAILIPHVLYFNHIAINGEDLKTKKNIVLKHNYLVTFYSILKGENNSENTIIINHEKIFRFVYYNRFFDPQG
ncbi:hypothetical protein [Geminocystis sp. NIES-3709]|uniref:hypothetical protein n=1 Tax=Geminocystis sp. NIES-3709 TaxID=1617448 RepID=UPI0005FC933A|nr:hypothetical protein [Geminocystis sp. NIES-3709]BAQ64815.1 hypothetical protein GM3709_1580 [Geminocystis sp. NIES-3709]